MSEDYGEILTPKEAAEYLKISETTLNLYLNAPENALPSYKLTRSTIRIRKSELDAWINKWVKGGE